MKPIANLTACARAKGMPRGGYIPKSQISWYVARFHVGTSDRTIARKVWRKARKYPRPIKRAMVRVAIKAHRRNRDVYAWLMRGM